MMPKLSRVFWRVPVRIYLWFPGSVFIMVGPWQSKACWSGKGGFVNGSRWFSGWHRRDSVKPF